MEKKELELELFNREHHRRTVTALLDVLSSRNLSYKAALDVLLEAVGCIQSKLDAEKRKVETRKFETLPPD